MADNVAITAGSGTPIATDEVQVSGTNAIGHVQFVKLVDGTLDGTGAIGGDAANGLDVDVTRLPALVAGTALVGKVSIDQVTANANEVVTKTGSTTVISAITAAAATNKVDVGLVNGEAVDVGAGTEAAAIRVTLPTNGTGVIATVSTVTAVTAITNALPAGDNNIGNVDIVTINSVAPAFGTGARGATVQRVTIATDDLLDIEGAIAHDGIDSGNPVKIGYKAIAHGTNPGAVAAADRTDGYANRHGIPFVMGGHPNVISLRATYAALQTDVALVTVSAGTKIVVTQIQVTVSNATTATPSVIIGFGTANTPTTTGVVLAHPGIPGGGGVSRGDGSGILGIGADDADLRITISVPTGGALDVVVSYYTIES